MATDDIIYIDSNPNGRILATSGTIYWRSGTTHYLLTPLGIERIDVPVIKDPIYSSPIYAGKKFIYRKPNESWQKTGGYDKIGWVFLGYISPTNNGTGASGSVPIPTPTPTPTRIVESGSMSGSFYGNFNGQMTGSFYGPVTASNIYGNTYIVTNSYFISGGYYHLTHPTDGQFGTDTSVAGLREGDTVDDAFDKIDSLLSLLIPPKPDALSMKTLTILASYSAIYTTLHAQVSNVVNTTKPTFQISDSFYDGNAGILTAYVNSMSSSKQLTTASDVGRVGDLVIYSDFDPYNNIQGKQGFYKSLTAGIEVSASLLVGGPYKAKLGHTKTGNTNEVTFFVDSPTYPTILSTSIDVFGLSHVSGVPALVAGANQANIIVSSSINGAIGLFYNSTAISTVTGTGIGGSVHPQPINQPVSGAICNVAIKIPVTSPTYAVSPALSLTAYASDANIRTKVDYSYKCIHEPVGEYSNRKYSGQGRYPSAYGGTYDSMTALTSMGNEELQFTNGKFQYPNKINYSLYYPTAPDYSALLPGTYNTCRWVTLDLGTVTLVSNLILQFTDVENFISTIGGMPQPGFELYTKIVGATGWVNGNSAYPGAGSPINDGDSALVVASSTSTMRVITFGVGVHSGRVLCRIGIPADSTKKFKNITLIQ